MISTVAPEAASRFVQFVNASPTPFHAVQNAILRLEKAGFRKIREVDEWEKDIKKGGKYFFTRNQSSLLAFTIPQKWSPGTGVSIVATHIDSPNLRVRPISKKTKEGYLQVGVETYGGGIWHSWLDRDLSLAGRILTAGEDGSFASKLIKIDRPLLRIPTLAIHLDRNVNDNFKFNQETEFVPILGQIADKFNQDNAHKQATLASSIQDNHHPALLSLLAGELNVSP